MKVEVTKLILCMKNTSKMKTAYKMKSEWILKFGFFGAFFQSFQYLAPVFPWS